MSFKKYTQCYLYDPTNRATKPFNIKDAPMEALVHAILAFTLMGSFVITGLVIAGPIGAIVGGIIGFVVGITTGVATLISEVSDMWRFHRLICLGENPQCAVGTVTEGPMHSDLGALDNDEFFDLVLMPHRKEDNYVTLNDPPTSQNATPPFYGTVAPEQMQNIRDHPRNEIYADAFQGELFLLPKAVFLPPNPDLGYNNQNKDPNELHTLSMLHCEAEGDFWVRMKDFAVALGLLATLLTAAVIAGAVAGGSAGAAAGCALGAWFFGPIGCAIGAIIGAILGAAAGAAAAGAAGGAGLIAILQAIFDADPGDVEDANVGDKELGEIVEGNRVAVLGEHVYDGFHQGWHEIHPLMAVMKIEPDNAKDSPFLTWAPQFRDDGHLPIDLPGMPAEALGLTAEDLRQGLNSERFASRAKWLRKTWCEHLSDAFSSGTRTAQQGLTNRWTIHPLVDGCDSNESDARPPIH